MARQLGARVEQRFSSTLLPSPDLRRFVIAHEYLGSRVSAEDEGCGAWQHEAYARQYASKVLREATRQGGSGARARQPEAPSRLPTSCAHALANSRPLLLMHPPVPA